MPSMPAPSAGYKLVFAGVTRFLSDEIKPLSMHKLMIGTTLAGSENVMRGRAGMIDASEARHAILHKDQFTYSAHPHIAVAANGDWVVIFNKAPRRPFRLLPPEDPLYCNFVMRSTDEGRTWSAPQVAPAYGWHGVECAGLTTLSDGRMMLNQWRFRWYPLGLARTQETLVFPEIFLRTWAQSPEHDGEAYGAVPPQELTPWARGGGETFVHISDDHGQSWTETHRIDTAPYSGGYGMRGACELASGDLLLPLSNVPNYRTVFVVCSSDGGRNWDPPIRVASEPGKEFEEPSLLRLSDGHLLMLLRENTSRHLHQALSEDDGRTWSTPRQLPIAGYPPHLLLLPDGRILCTYGWRQPDFRIRAVLSEDGGATWDVDREVCIRGDLPNKDLGYPGTVAANDGALFTVYYAQDENGVTCIQGTWWCL